MVLDQSSLGLSGSFFACSRDERNEMWSQILRQGQTRFLTVDVLR